jgi:hypothetical protein
VSAPEIDREQIRDRFAEELEKAFRPKAPRHRKPSRFQFSPRILTAMITVSCLIAVAGQVFTAYLH